MGVGFPTAARWAFFGALPILSVESRIGGLMGLPNGPILPPPPLDVATLLELSEAQPRVNWFWYGLGLFMLLVTMSTFGSAYSPGMRQVIELLSVLVLFGLMGVIALVTSFTVRRYRAQQQTVDAIEELMQLRRWEEAGMALQIFLSQPASSPRLRAQALVYLSSLLARHHRYEDAIAVQTYLLDHELVDESSSYGVRLGRAMAMLHEDHLVDADRALSDLRRHGGAERSGGLALLEIYRDVKTGHPAEAIELFSQRLGLMRQQLGHRVADAHALVARANDMLGRDAEAQAEYERATLLSPVNELLRRYPELGKLAEKYHAAAAPTEGM
jgi:tetratricopeptide (TPR) repeat protein